MFAWFITNGQSGTPVDKYAMRGIITTSNGFRGRVKIPTGGDALNRDKPATCI